MPASTSHAEGERELLEGHVWYLASEYGPDILKLTNVSFHFAQVNGPTRREPSVSKKGASRREPLECSRVAILKGESSDRITWLPCGQSVCKPSPHGEKASLCTRGKKKGSSIQFNNRACFCIFILFYVARILCYVQNILSYLLTIHCYSEYS